MGRPITQEDLEFIESINFKNSLIFYKKFFLYFIIIFIIYNLKIKKI